MYGSAGESARLDLALVHALAWLMVAGSEKFTPHARLIGLLTEDTCARCEEIRKTI
jgi:hypothetical protein